MSQQSQHHEKTILPLNYLVCLSPIHLDYQIEAGYSFGENQTSPSGLN